MASTFDQVVNLVGRSLRREWVYWTDDARAAYDRRFVHFARRSTRGYERTAVITVAIPEGGVTLSVASEGMV